MADAAAQRMASDSLSSLTRFSSGASHGRIDLVIAGVHQPFDGSAAEPFMSRSVAAFRRHLGLGQREQLFHDRIALGRGDRRRGALHRSAEVIPLQVPNQTQQGGDPNRVVFSLRELFENKRQGVDQRFRRLLVGAGAPPPRRCSSR